MAPPDSPDFAPVFPRLTPLRCLRDLLALAVLVPVWLCACYVAVGYLLCVALVGRVNGGRA